MKQTVTVNLAGVVFHIDDDAYAALDQYLKAIRSNIESESADEVMQDIEARIAELFDQHKRYGHSEVVTIAMVNDVMEQMGTPEMIGGEGEKSAPTDETETAANAAENVDNQADVTFDGAGVKKRLYRDVEDKKVGGVCSGLAAYFGIDPIWLRLLFLGLLFLEGIGLLTYLVLWALVPAANTSARRLEMQGVAPSAENIRREVENRPDDAGAEKKKDSGNGCAWGCLIALAILFGLPVLFAFVVAILALVGASCLTPLAVLPDAIIDGSLLGVLCTLLFFAIPVVSLIIWAVRRNNVERPLTKWFWLVVVLLWMLSVVGMFSGFRMAARSVINLGWEIPERMEEWARHMEGFAVHMEAASEHVGADVKVAVMGNADPTRALADSVENSMKTATDTIDLSAGLLEVIDDTIAAE